jgi:hypothetical protein
MQNQNDLTGGMEHITLDLWLTTEEQRQLAAITDEHNASFQAMRPDAQPLQSSEYLRALIGIWLREEYQKVTGMQPAAEQREKEHGQ